jgi:hypothetical protein
MLMATGDLPSSETARPRWPVLPVVGFLLGVLSYVVWALLGMLAPLLALAGVVVCWLALRRRDTAAAPLARWGLRLGLLHLALFAALLLVGNPLMKTAA